MALTHYSCPACHEDGLSFRSRFMSGRLWPGGCRLCQAKVRPHGGWATLHLVLSNLAVLGTIVVFLLVAQVGAASGGVFFSVIGAIIVLVIATYTFIPMTEIKPKT